ncbi:hypothetical protein EU522_01840 [Candidatus Thorarchaeota archaeon]|nr:MAG: hypothetical protein EU522_01840 [Candidatus Thorarchaeota archaeon]
MTLEEDSIAVMQSVILLAGPILTLKVAALWQGVLAGEPAKTQAWLAFSSDPVAILGVVACAGSALCFWVLMLIAWRMGIQNEKEVGQFEGFSDC